MDNGTFTALQKKIDDANNGSITLYNDYIYDEGFTTEGINVNKDLTIYGNGFTISGNKTSRIFNVTGGNVLFRDIIFVKGYTAGDGGAILGEFNAINCTFNNNEADGNGGAMWHGVATDCTFYKNAGGRIGGSCGGAICEGTATNCNFIENMAGYGGAIYDTVATNCYFKSNVGWDFEGAARFGIVDSCVFDEDSICDVNPPAFYNPTFSVDNFSSMYLSGDKLVFNLRAYRTNQPITNRNIEVTLYYQNGTQLKTIDLSSGDGWTVDLPVGNYIAECKPAQYNIESYNATLNVTQSDSGIQIIPHNIVVNDVNGRMFAIILPKNATGNLIINLNGVISTINITPEIQDENGTVLIKNRGVVGEYDLMVTYSGDGNYKSSTASATSSIIKIGTVIIPVISLKFGEKSSMGYMLGPKSSGQVKFSSSNPKAVRVTNSGSIVAVGIGSSIVTITYSGNENYAKSSCSFKVIVSKATPKLTAAKKTFKRNVKTKKYSIILKTDKNNPLAKVKVTIKVKGKTYKATTNAKGQATFKIKNLKKKGKFTATVKFAGNAYYKAATKKVKIVIK